MPLKCPNCGHTFKNSSFCPNCGVDVVLLQKTQSASNKLYNKGLSQAKMGDLTGACESLLQSVTFCKRNEKARNLLGLVYFEMGHIADALMQWIISASLVKENNPAKKYIDSLQNNARQMDKLNDSVRMYNQAIVYLNQRSEDLAMIQLKKAVDFNSKFLEGWNLLALCYIEQGEIGKAGICIEKVLNQDRNNQKATEYARLINPKKGKKELQKERDRMQNYRASKPAASYRHSEKSYGVIGKTEIISFIVGIICTTAVLMTLIVPAWVDAKTTKIAELEKQIAEIQTGGGSVNLAEENRVLKEENQRLKAENEQYHEQETLQVRLDKINEAATLYDQKENETSALLLAEINSEGLPEDAELLYRSLKENVYPEAAKSFYTTARSQYMNKNYDEASVNFENSLKFASEEDFVDDSIYYLGKIAELNGDIEKAKSYFQRIINEFPDSNQFKNAENSLNH